MTDKNNVPKQIDDYSFFYAIYRIYISFCLKRIYYRKYTVIFDEPIDENTPIVLASNHQNALMDGLNVSCSSKRQTVFFGRADIFKKKIAIKFLSLIKIEPIYRIRDGKDSVKLNDKVFDVAQKILERHNVIGIFPEGAHNNREKLMPLKKGIARIVFSTEDNNAFNLGVKIIPVGISYENYFNFGRDIRIHYGKAIHVSDYKSFFEVNPSIAYNKLNETLSEGIKKRIIHINNDEEHFFIQKLRRTFAYHKFKGKYNLDKSFLVSKDLTEKLDILSLEKPDKYLSLKEKAIDFYNLLKENNIMENLMFAKEMSFINIFLYMLFIIITFPIFLVGTIANYIPFILPYWFCNKKIKDKQFHSSLSFASSALFVFPIYYFLQSFILFVLLGNLPLTLIVFLTYIPLGLFAFNYRKLFLRVFQQIKYIYLPKDKNKYNQLLINKDILILELEKLINS